MPRRKISEYRAKKLVTKALNTPYTGWSINSPEVAIEITGYKSYVVKVDQAVKGRFKKGLVLLEVAQTGLEEAIKSLQNKGYGSFLVEPYATHDQKDERYFAFMHDRSGYHFLCSKQGGVDIEQNAKSIKNFVITDNFDWSEAAKTSGLSDTDLKTLFDLFKKNFMTFLEINPYLIVDGKPIVLDAAVEVDDAGEYFVDDWSEADIRNPRLSTVTPEEDEIKKLDAGSPASFNLSVLNPDGSVFLLLSGGGASVVVADEVHNLGLGKELANYGEYSGNPNTDETYLYTSQVLKLMLKSKAERKVLFVGGAVANFTDIANTFAGIIRALDEYGGELKKQGVKIYVRRGGPRQEIGLAKIKTALEKHGLLGGVYDPKTSIPAALREALKGLTE